MNTEIKQWLLNPKREVKVGVQLFKKYADRQMLQKYADYFERTEAENKPMTMAYNMLVQKLTMVERTTVAFNPTQPIGQPQERTEQTEETKPATKSKKKSEKRIGRTSTYPIELQDTVKRLKEIAPLITSLKTQLADKDCKEPKQKSAQIVELEKERRELWAKIDNYDPTTE